MPYICRFTYLRCMWEFTREDLPHKTLYLRFENENRIGLSRSNKTINVVHLHIQVGRTLDELYTTLHSEYDYLMELTCNWFPAVYSLRRCLHFELFKLLMLTEELRILFIVNFLQGKIKEDSMKYSNFRWKCQNIVVYIERIYCWCKTMITHCFIFF